jgi:hypothetical protein
MRVALVPVLLGSRLRAAVKLVPWLAHPLFLREAHSSVYS